MNDVTNWGGVLLDRRILNELRVGDIVRVISEEWGARYVEINNVCKNGYFKGFITDPYHWMWCNVCDKPGKKGNYLYGCEGDSCNFHCHLSCLKRQPNAKTCNCKLTKPGLQNGEWIVFKKNNISEVPDWSKNTERLIDHYRSKENRGYLLTGWR